MKKKVFIVFFVLALLCTGIYADSPPRAGEVLETSGNVFVDVFGTGDYIPCHRGEFLYRPTVIRTGEGSLLLELNTREIQIPPGVTVSLDEILDTRKREEGLPWLKTFVLKLKSRADALVFGGENVPLGTELNPALDHQPIMLGEVQFTEKALERVKEKMNREDYAGALALLDAFPGTESQWVELRGYCYFRLGLYKKNIEVLLPLAGSKPFIDAQIALSYYLLGNKETAAPYLERSRELFGQMKLREEFIELGE